MNKIHAYGCFKWTRPVHEVLEYTCQGTYKEIIATDIQFEHYPDKTKSRKNYLPLLKLSVKADTTDLGNLHYVGICIMKNGINV